MDEPQLFAGLPLRQLEDELVEGALNRSLSKHRLLQLLAEFDRRGGWVLKGATSCAVWWADVCGIELNTSREQLRVARSLCALPQLDAALASGRLSYAKIRVISRYANEDNVDELIAMAETCPAGRLGVLIAAWQQSRQSNEAISAAQYGARSMSWRTEPDGMITFIARLRPAEAGAVQAAIEAIVMRANAAHGATLPQLRADALHILSAKGGNAVQTEVVVNVSVSEDGSLAAALEDGTPLPEPQLNEILCESTIRALLHDSEGRPIDASPLRKAPTTRQMRLLAARDKCCQYEGCSARSFLHAHHVIHRGRGGKTVLVNLILLCSFHHRMIHEEEHWEAA